MTICFVNPDGSHVQGCHRHNGDHPVQWCNAAYERRLQKVMELEKELSRLRTEDPGNEFTQSIAGEYVHYPNGDFEPVHKMPADSA